MAVEKATELYGLEIQYSHSAILRRGMEIWVNRYQTGELPVSGASTAIANYDCKNCVKKIKVERRANLIPSGITHMHATKS
jgi:hypothetical protein